MPPLLPDEDASVEALGRTQETTKHRESIMLKEIGGLRDGLRRWTLLLGVLQVIAGCLVGFIPPSAVAWFRGIVMAHIEFTANGVLMIAVGLLAGELALRPTALKVWFAALQI